MDDEHPQPSRAYQIALNHEVRESGSEQSDDDVEEKFLRFLQNSARKDDGEEGSESNSSNSGSGNSSGSGSHRGESDIESSKGYSDTGSYVTDYTESSYAHSPGDVSGSTTDSEYPDIEAELDQIHHQDELTRKVKEDESKVPNQENELQNAKVDPSTNALPEESRSYIRNDSATTTEKSVQPELVVSPSPDIEAIMNRYRESKTTEDSHKPSGENIANGSDINDPTNNSENITSNNSLSVSDSSPTKSSSARSVGFAPALSDRQNTRYAQVTASIDNWIHGEDFDFGEKKSSPSQSTSSPTLQRKKSPLKTSTQRLSLEDHLKMLKDNAETRQHMRRFSVERKKDREQEKEEMEREAKAKTRAEEKQRILNVKRAVRAERDKLPVVMKKEQLDALQPLFPHTQTVGAKSMNERLNEQRLENQRKIKKRQMKDTSTRAIIKDITSMPQVASTARKEASSRYGEYFSFQESLAKVKMQDEQAMKTQLARELKNDLEKGNEKFPRSLSPERKRVVASALEGTTSFSEAIIMSPGAMRGTVSRRGSDFSSPKLFSPKLRSRDISSPQFQLSPKASPSPSRTRRKQVTPQPLQLNAKKAANPTLSPGGIYSPKRGLINSPSSSPTVTKNRTTPSAAKPSIKPSATQSAKSMFASSSLPFSPPAVRPQIRSTRASNLASKQSKRPATKKPKPESSSGSDEEVVVEDEDSDDVKESSSDGEAGTSSIQLDLTVVGTSLGIKPVGEPSGVMAEEGGEGGVEEEVIKEDEGLVIVGTSAVITPVVEEVVKPKEEVGEVEEEEGVEETIASDEINGLVIVGKSAVLFSGESPANVSDDEDINIVDDGEDIDIDIVDDSDDAEASHSRNDEVQVEERRANTFPTLEAGEASNSTNVGAGPSLQAEEISTREQREAFEIREKEAEQRRIEKEEADNTRQAETETREKEDRLREAEKLRLQEEEDVRLKHAEGTRLAEEERAREEAERKHKEEVHQRLEEEERVRLEVLQRIKKEEDERAMQEVEEHLEQERLRLEAEEADRLKKQHQTSEEEREEKELEEEERRLAEELARIEEEERLLEQELANADNENKQEDVKGAQDDVKGVEDDVKGEHPVEEVEKVDEAKRQQTSAEDLDEEAIEEEKRLNAELARIEEEDKLKQEDVKGVEEAEKRVEEAQKAEKGVEEAEKGVAELEKGVEEVEKGAEEPEKGDYTDDKKQDIDEMNMPRGLRDSPGLRKRKGNRFDFKSEVLDDADTTDSLLEEAEAIKSQEEERRRKEALDREEDAKRVKEGKAPLSEEGGEEEAHDEASDEERVVDVHGEESSGAEKSGDEDEEVAEGSDEEQDEEVVEGSGEEQDEEVAEGSDEDNEREEEVAEGSGEESEESEIAAREQHEEDEEEEEVEASGSEVESEEESGEDDSDEADSESEEADDLRVGVSSLQGPRHENQDRYRVLEDMNIGSTQMSFFGLYDGHGGKGASEYLAQHLHLTIFDSTSFSEDIDKAIVDGFLDIEKQFEKTGLGGSSSSPGCGSCAIVTIVQNNEGGGGSQVIVANLGDSRAVLARKDEGGSLEAVPLSVDHTADSEKDRIVASGGFVMGGRVFGVIEPSRTIGDYAYKYGYLDVVLARPELKHVNVTPSDKFLIMGTDGFFGSVSNEEAVKIADDALSRGRGAAGASAALTLAAQSRGSKDDITAIVVVL